MISGNIVFEFTTGTGTGNLTLSDTSSDSPAKYFRRFSDAFGTGSSNTFYYCVRNRDLLEYEVGIGYMSDANTLVRSSVIESSNSNNLVNFSAGSKDIISDMPANLQNRLEKYRTISSSTSLPSRESHTFCNNTGAGALVEISLPAGAQDLKFGFLVTNANGFKLIANGTDTIRIAGSVSTAGGSMTCTQLGGAVVIYGHSGGWTAVSSQRTWIDS